MTIADSTSHPFARLLALALLTLAGTACAIDPVAPPVAPPVTTAASAPLSARLLEPVTALIGDAACDTQSQCHAIGIGAKACGGPSGYLAWSDKATAAGALRSAVEAQARAAEEENRTSGMLSNCMIAPVPSATCRPRASDGKKTCQLGQGGASSAV